MQVLFHKGETLKFERSVPPRTILFDLTKSIPCKCVIKIAMRNEPRVRDGGSKVRSCQII